VFNHILHIRQYFLYTHFQGNLPPKLFFVIGLGGILINDMAIFSEAYLEKRSEDYTKSGKCLLSKKNINQRRDSFVFAKA